MLHSISSATGHSLRDVLGNAEINGAGDVRFCSCTADSQSCQSGDVFVAIGAAHLHGHDGVLAQLAQGGYRIERMPVEEPTAATPAAKTAATMPGTRPATMPENPR